MVNQLLRVYAPLVAQRCSELGRHNADYIINIGIKHGLDILRNGVSSPFMYITLHDSSKGAIVLRFPKLDSGAKKGIQFTLEGGKRPPPFNKIALHAGGQRFKSSTAHHSVQ